ncbi:hypothetical protein [Acutalibacter muris]|jgi:hypothetical protein|uniref:hypothetical protein n=1 Tax=Acutalibacter muris TaxID=1796620 RepID=UPI001C3ED290|nr:hypothetical protein [Acutalibacter muris]
MTAEQVYSAYLLWLGETPPKLLQQIFDFPAANCDIFEDEHSVVNRLFFLIPHTIDGELRCFSFFEENTFSKDDWGDLSLVRSSLHLVS